MENKTAKIPVASHGLHRHNYNYPWLSSINFGDVMPCYYNPVRKGERDNPKAGVFSQLMPIAHNAFATGRFNFKAIFVPYKLVWRPWYAFDQQTEYYTNGTSMIPGRYPYITQDELLKAIINGYATPSADANVSDFRVIVSSSVQPSDAVRYDFTSAGRRVFRVLCALGCCPSFVSDDKTPINILHVLCYIKAYSDYYFPNNYVGNTHYKKLALFFDRDTIDFTSFAADFLQALDICSLNFYENTIFDLAWDNPATPNVLQNFPNVSISDVTDPSGDLGSVQVNNTSVDVGTPAVTDSTASGVNGFTQYILNALKSVSMWAKRRQLSGARLLDKFLVSRGISLPNDSARISYFLGERNIEIEVSGVENNTDINLGELAGRGIASSGNNPLSFECRPDDDGIFFIIVSPIPDANFPILFDGYSNRRDYLDNYTAEYDKLGSAAVPSAVVARSLDGLVNNLVNPQQQRVFGFLNQYWDEVQEKPRLLGDFILNSRGAIELQAYHTFRLFSANNSSAYAHHSYDFIRMSDSEQYQRLFYSEEQENLMLFLRWYGSQYKEKLPLGDSYDWDDDEMNRKVNIVVGGSQK